jgi:alpha-ketoglutarate-dependent taurine dioxygenase
MKRAEPMNHEISELNGSFGILVDNVRRDDLSDADFQQRAYDLWTRHGGLLVVRGDDLSDLSAQQLMNWSKVFGEIEEGNMVAREDKTVEGLPILRIGNTKNEAGKPKAQFAKVPQLTSDADVQYNPETRRPVWHTDSTFRQNPPIGSVFHCKIAPPEGAETLFADTRSAYSNLDDAKRKALDPLEAVCSLAHHDKKISLYSPNYPILTPEQRAANPPNRVPIVLKHPVSGEPALYGMNSSTCAVVPQGEDFSGDRLDKCDLEGIEDDSVMILRELLPYITGPDFTVRWRWRAGDVVVWDNRSTMHAATGFENEKYDREMWRLTLVN